MLSENHRKAQDLAIQATLAAKDGNWTLTESQYLAAAKAERLAINGLAASSVRTRGILAVSLVSMLYKARAYDQAERSIHEFLASDDLQAPARVELRHLLDVIGDDRAMADLGKQYSGEEIMIALRKGRVGYGTAPVETFLHNVGGFNSLYYRTAEWQGGFPFRKRGLPSKDVLQSFQARVTQPTAGSYRFTIRLLEPYQNELFAPPRIQPSMVAESIIKVVKLTSEGSVEKLSAFVPDMSYRETMVKLIRNLVPMGKNVGEVELTRLSRSATNRRENAVLLVPATKENVSAVISTFAAKDGPAPTKIKGVLRALDLDKSFIDVTGDDGIRHHLYTEKGNLFDDVVGPMVNRRVVISSQFGKHGKIIVRDIELDQDAEEND